METVVARTASGLLAVLPKGVTAVQGERWGGACIAELGWGLEPKRRRRSVAGRDVGCELRRAEQQPMVQARHQQGLSGRAA